MKMKFLKRQEMLVGLVTMQNISLAQQWYIKTESQEWGGTPLKEIRYNKNVTKSTDLGKMIRIRVVYTQRCSLFCTLDLI